MNVPLTMIGIVQKLPVVRQPAANPPAAAAGSSTTTTTSPAPAAGTESGKQHAGSNAETRHHYGIGKSGVTADTPRPNQLPQKQLLNPRSPLIPQILLRLDASYSAYPTYPQI